MHSRAPAQQQTSDVDEWNGEVDTYVRAIFNSLPATDKRLLQIQAAQEENPTCILLKKHCLEGWPSKQKLKGEISKYLHTASELSICEGLILRNSRIVIPKASQKDILQKLHSGHQGINKCKRRAAQSVWWPGLNKDLETMVSNCYTCCKMQSQQDAIPASRTTNANPITNSAMAKSWSRSSRNLLISL